MTIESLIKAANYALARYSPNGYGGDEYRNYMLALAQAIQAASNNSSFVTGVSLTTEVSTALGLA